MAGRECAGKPQDLNLQRQWYTTKGNGKLDGSKIDTGTQNGSPKGTEATSRQRTGSENTRQWRSGKQNGNVKLKTQCVSHFFSRSEDKTLGSNLPKASTMYLEGLHILG